MKKAIHFSYNSNQILNYLIIVNAAVFILVNLSTHLFGINPEIFLGFPSDLSNFLFRFWTFFTYMFTHADLGHVFYNLVWLYFMGQAFQVVLGSGRIFFVYVLGGIGGALAFLLFGALFPHLGGNILIGASASVMAIAVAIGFYAPEMPVNMLFIGEVKIKWVVLVCFLLSTLIDFSVNTGGKISHLGGAIFGMIYAIQLKKGIEFKLKIPAFKKNKKSNLKLVYRSNKKTELNSLSKEEKQKLLNEILEKIHQSGYESLSSKEKEILHELSKN